MESLGMVKCAKISIRKWKMARKKEVSRGKRARQKKECDCSFTRTVDSAEIKSQTSREKDREGRGDQAQY